MISWLQRIHPVLNHLWRGSWRKGRLEPARYLYDHELVMVMDGGCRVEVEGEPLELTKGSWIIIPPAENHSTVATAPKVTRVCFHFHWLPVEGERPAAICSFHPKRPLLRQIILAPSYVPRKRLRGEFVPEGPVPGLIESIFHRRRMADALSNQLADTYFLELLIHLLIPPSRVQTKEDPSRRIAYAAKEVLEADGAVQEGIQEQLGALGFSYEHVCRLFSRTFGVTPAAYRNAVRLERAKTLLRDPKLTIAQVAYKAGFDDPAYFTRLFHRQNGVPPSHFR